MHVKVSRPGIGGQRYIEMVFQQFCINPEILGNYVKLSELYLNVSVSSNGRGKPLKSIEMLSHTGQNFNAMLCYALRN